MKVQFQSDDAVGTAFKRDGVRAVRRMLRRLKWLVTSVRIRLDDVNGPDQGGVDKRCRVEVGVRGQPPVAVTAMARSWQGAVEMVALQVRRRVVLRLRAAAPSEPRRLSPRAARSSLPFSLS